MMNKFLVLISILLIISCNDNYKNKPTKKESLIKVEKKEELVDIDKLVQKEKLETEVKPKKEVKKETFLSNFFKKVDPKNNLLKSAFRTAGVITYKYVKKLVNEIQTTPPVTQNSGTINPTIIKQNKTEVTPYKRYPTSKSKYIIRDIAPYADFLANITRTEILRNDNVLGEIISMIPQNKKVNSKPTLTNEQIISILKSPGPGLTLEQQNMLTKDQLELISSYYGGINQGEKDLKKGGKKKIEEILIKIINRNIKETKSKNNWQEDRILKNYGRVRGEALIALISGEWILKEAKLEKGRSIIKSNLIFNTGRFKMKLDASSNIYGNFPIIDSKLEIDPYNSFLAKRYSVDNNGSYIGVSGEIRLKLSHLDNKNLANQYFSINYNNGERTIKKQIDFYYLSIIRLNNKKMIATSEVEIPKFAQEDGDIYEYQEYEEEEDYPSETNSYELKRISKRDIKKLKIHKPKGLETKIIIDEISKDGVIEKYKKAKSHFKEAEEYYRKKEEEYDKEKKNYDQELIHTTDSRQYITELEGIIRNEKTKYEIEIEKFKKEKESYEVSMESIKKPRIRILAEKGNIDLEVRDYKKVKNIRKITKKVKKDAFERYELFTTWERI